MVSEQTFAFSLLETARERNKDSSGVSDAGGGRLTCPIPAAAALMKEE